MGLRDWRERRSLKDPVRGEFHVTGQYFAHPNGNSFREMLTGVVSGPGVAATAGEHLDDPDGRYIGHDVLPALIDRSRPSRFIVLWDEIAKPDFRAQAREQAQQAAREAQDGGQTVGGNEPTPAWATDLIADLTRQGVIPGEVGAAYLQQPIIVNMPDQVIDLTSGGVSAGDAAQLMITGEVATAVLTAVSDVPVPSQALPGPTASLCDLALQVTRASGASYAARTRLGFVNAARRASIAVIGATLPVRIDPDDQTRVVVDSVAFDAHRTDLTKQPPGT